MKGKYLLIVLMFHSLEVLSQKPPLDLSVLSKWPSVGDGQISSDGQYTLYSVKDKISNSIRLVVQSIDNKWKMEVPEGTQPLITQDSRHVLFIKSWDSLGILRLGTDSLQYIPNVKNYQVSKNGTGNWVIYSTKDSSKSLALRDINTGKEKYFLYADNYFPATDADILFVQTSKGDSTLFFHKITRVDLSTWTEKTVWSNESSEAANQEFTLIMNKTGSQMAFLIKDSLRNERVTSLFFYRDGNETALPIYSDSSLQASDGLYLEQMVQFSKDDSLLFVYLKEKLAKRVLPDIVKLDVWSYKDTKLQSEQEKDLGPKTFLASICLSDKKLTRLLNQNESGFIPGKKYDDCYLIVYAKKGDANYDEQNWNPACRTTAFLEDTRTGQRKLIEGLPWFAVGPGSKIYISPRAQYAVYYDPTIGNYFSYQISSGTKVNITKGIRTMWTDYGDDLPSAPYNSYGIGGWLAGDSAVLLYDQWDIWLVDVSGIRQPINLTNGYGRAHNLQFGLPFNFGNIIGEHDTLILNAFNRNNKQAGFFSITISQKAPPKMLTMGPYVYNIFSSSSGVQKYVKARDKNVYLVRRECTTDFPNYYITYDFKTFSAVSRIQPQQEYNWISSQLLTWKMFDGKIGQGILYRPEDFDPQKKYPLLITYYEKNSDGLNQYLSPMLMADRINIPWFVSNDYLVFVPDIYYKIGYPGKSSYNSIVSGAEYLAQMPWVDAHKMGLYGHSFGGYETNYVITHSHLFVAAMSASAVADLISDYLALWGNGNSKQGSMEIAQYRIGTSLWEKGDLYIQNSPIFKADQVTTPLLMMNNKLDGAVPFANGVEFFTALRRLGKKVWMLQYDGENHSVINEKAENDYTIRVTQFFNYYLKEMSPPLWMTDGVPAKKNGFETGLPLTTSYTIP